MTVTWFETRLPTFLPNYLVADIYNTDEYALLYQALPSKSMHLKKEKCVGGDFSKQRLTGLATSNALAQKLPMFIIGKKISQDASKIWNIFLGATGAKKNWMNSDLFEDWVREQDNKFEGQNRNVLLIVDNCPAHPEIGGLKAIVYVFCHRILHL